MPITDAWLDNSYNLLVRNVAPSGLTGDVYLRLFEASPPTDGTVGGDELLGVYTRPEVSAKLSNPIDGTGLNTSMIAFENLPAGTVTHWALCNSASGSTTSTVIVTEAFDTPHVISSGDSLVIPAGTLTFSF